MLGIQGTNIAVAYTHELVFDHVFTATVSFTSEVLQQLDLSQRPLREDLLAKHVCDFLDGDTFLSLYIRGGAEQIYGN